MITLFLIWLFYWIYMTREEEIRNVEYIDTIHSINKQHEENKKLIEEQNKEREKSIDEELEENNKKYDLMKLIQQINIEIRSDKNNLKNDIIKLNLNNLRDSINLRLSRNIITREIAKQQLELISEFEKCNTIDEVYKKTDYYTEIICGE